MQATIFELQNFVSVYHEKIRFNTRTNAPEFLSGLPLTSKDYKLLKVEAENFINKKVSSRLLRTLLNSNLTPSYTPPPPISIYYVEGRPEYEILRGRPYALLYRKHGSQETDLCPFCGKKHGHGKAPGHRVSHCSFPNKNTNSEISSSDGTILKLDDGYIIKEYFGNDITIPAITDISNVPLSYQYTVITENDESEWDDNTGVSYHFPKKYLKFLESGTKVVYYKGKQKNSEYTNKRLSKEPHYFGLATIGDVTPDTVKPGSYYASIVNYIPFNAPVHIRDQGKQTYEIIPISRLSNYWRDGVRPINEEIYQSILTSTGINSLEPLSEIYEIPLSVVKATLSNKPLLKVSHKKNIEQTNSTVTTKQYYSPNSKKVGDRGEEIVYNYSKEKLTPEEAQTVTWLAQEGKTPGYDIEYHNINGDKVCIEVKSTTAKSFVQFLFTINELKAAETHKENYIIYLVSDCLGPNPMIDLVFNPFIQFEDGSLVLEPIAFKVSRKEQE